MPITSFEGDTFVSFIDISGFKYYMSVSHNKALEVLNCFYETGYSVLSEIHYRNYIEGLFVSDCGILFVRNTTDSENNRFQKMIAVVKEINRRMIDNNIMLTSTISYGKFAYNQRFEFIGIEKNELSGHAYLEAYLDNSFGQPKISPGMCRILKENLPEVIVNSIQNRNDDIFKLISEKPRHKNHYYFYWMVNDKNEINNFEQRYRTCSEYSKYAGMIKALKGENCL